MQYVLDMDYSELCKPIDKEQLFQQLNIENPLVVLLVEHWIRVRRNRLDQEQMMLEKVQKAKEQFAKLQ